MSGTSVQSSKDGTNGGTISLSQSTRHVPAMIVVNCSVAEPNANAAAAAEMPWVFRYIPFANPYDLSLAFAFGAGVTTLLVIRRPQFRFVAGVALPLAAIILVLARFIGSEFIDLPPVQAAVDQAKAEPDNFEAQIKAAEVYYQIQKFDGAIEFLKQANKLKPEDYETIVNLGNAYFDTGKYTDAETTYVAALVKKADDVNVRTDLGLTFIFRDPPNYERAVQEFTRSLQTDPNHIQTPQNLTVASTKKGDAAKAKETLSRLETVNSGNTAIPKLREEIQKIETKQPG